MRQLIDLRCPDCGRESERYISDVTTQCPCGGTMHKVIGMPNVRLEGVTGHFPGAADHWAKIREDKHRIKAAREG